MNNDYYEDDWSLPNGCKDVYDVLKLEAAKLGTTKPAVVKHDVAEEATLPLPAGFRTAITDVGFVISARLPGLRSEDVEITVEGNRVRISIAKADGYGSFNCVIGVPSGYRAGDARAAYLNDELQIVIPKQLDYHANQPLKSEDSITENF